MNTDAKSLLAYSFPKLQDGSLQALNQYAGNVILVVNVASYCGLTPQYAGLEKLYAEYKSRGFVILGFPSNEFGAQEPLPEAEIAQFCTRQFGVTFPMFAKTTVTSGNANPFYAELAAATGSAPQWNFHKYLIDRSATKILSFGSMVTPDAPELIAMVKQWLDVKN